MIVISYANLAALQAGVRAEFTNGYTLLALTYSSTDFYVAVFQQI